MSWLFAKRLRSYVRLAGSTDSAGGLAPNRLARRALVPLGFCVALLVVWAATGPLPDPIVVPARLTVALGPNGLQHAEASRLLDELDAERIRKARATAEAALVAVFEPPARLVRSPTARHHVARETALFAARRRTLDEQVATLAAQIRDARARAGALTAEEPALAQPHVDEYRARIAEARGRYQKLAAIEAEQAAARINDLEARLRPFREPAGPPLEIAPSRTRVHVEARVRPQDITRVPEGAAASVRLPAHDARTTPLLTGKVVHVSATPVDVPAKGPASYLADVEIDVTSIARPPETRLTPGMAVELVVESPAHTFLRHLVKPLQALMSESIREP